MPRSLKKKLATLAPARRAAIEAEADRLHEEYLKRDEQRTSDRLPNFHSSFTPNGKPLDLS
ncbi:hypothetical protein [Boseongicola sp. H5]|uniref:hypothetical protein n=1 Tax=Boseongicola sp. H5 TaxID=2763261 RepID=UPI001D0BADBE|nr:hypothetical protein [Boseongicola sp. H5]